MSRYSIIMPAHNASGYIRKALESITCQVEKDYELIVVCDACEDDTAEIASSYGARVEEVDFRKAGPTRSRGLERYPTFRRWKAGKATVTRGSTGRR